jgi:hypothetical protein
MRHPNMMFQMESPLRAILFENRELMIKCLLVTRAYVFSSFLLFALWHFLLFLVRNIRIIKHAFIYLF